MIQIIRPSHPLAIALAGWLKRQQQAVTDYLIEESVFLRISSKGSGFKLWCTDKQRQLKKSRFSTQSGLGEWLPTESL
jgi:hypothetical protein